MDQREIEQILINVVCELQALSGRSPVPVSGSTRPVLDVPGFDSLNGVEATVEAIDRFQHELEFNNVFVENDKALSIQQAANRLLNCLKVKSRS